MADDRLRYVHANIVLSSGLLPGDGITAVPLSAGKSPFLLNGRGREPEFLGGHVETKELVG